MLETAYENEKENLNSLITTTKDLISDYQMYKQPMQMLPRGKYHITYSPAVASVIVFFNLSGYKLSAELLTHARDNNTAGSTYYPTNGDRISSSAVIQNICNGSLTEGSSLFPNAGSTIDKDLYYAIHKFKYIKAPKARTITLYDIYDYEEEKEYTGIAGVAIDTMAKAQAYGTIVPYYVRIIRSF